MRTEEDLCVLRSVKLLQLALYELRHCIQVALPEVPACIVALTAPSHALGLPVPRLQDLQELPLVGASLMHCFHAAPVPWHYLLAIISRRSCQAMLAGWHSD